MNAKATRPFDICLEFSRECLVPFGEIITAILDFCSESEKSLDEIADAIERSKDIVRTHYLKELLENGLLHLKYPESKNHPNQKYFVKNNKMKDN